MTNKSHDNYEDLLNKTKKFATVTDKLLQDSLELEETIDKVNKQIEFERQGKFKAETEGNLEELININKRLKNLSIAKEQLEKVVLKVIEHERLEKQEGIKLEHNLTANNTTITNIKGNKANFTFDIGLPSSQSTPLTGRGGTEIELKNLLSPKEEDESNKQENLKIQWEKDKAVGGEIKNVKTEINQRENIVTSNIGRNVEESATFAMNAKHIASIVPLFDGDGTQLRHFIECCQEALEMMPNCQDRELSLVKMLRGRLTGEARKTIYGINFQSLPEFVKHLKQIFGKREDEWELLGLLTKMYQKDTEKVISYANRVREIVRRILEAHSMETEQEDCNYFEVEIDKRTARYFTKGLQRDISRRMDPKITLRAAVKEALHFEKKDEEQKLLRGEMAN